MVRRPGAAAAAGGRSLVNCEAEIVDPQGTLVAKALATYKVG